MEEPELFKVAVPSLTKRKRRDPCEYKVVALRDCPLPQRLLQCDTPQRAAHYWRLHVETHPSFDPERESFVVLLLNTRNRVKGHHLVATGTLDSVMVHSREVFRVAIIAAAQRILVMHNHPSGDPSPSEADIRITRDLIRSGELLRIEVLDHVIIGQHGHRSLRELGHFRI